MNLREGTRRLALFLGAVGAILGGFASYMELSSVLNQKARHNRFEQLATSDTVRQVRTDWVLARIPPNYDALAKRLGGTTNVPIFDPDGKVRGVPIEDLGKALASGGERAIRFKAPDGTERWVRGSEREAAIRAGGVPNVPDYDDQQKLLAAIWRSFSQKRRDEMLAGMSQEQKSGLQALAQRQAQQGPDWFIENAPLPASEVNRSGIRTIHWSRDLGVDSIDTEDGQTFYPTAVPPAWAYLLIALIPVLGFISPWVAIRAIVWVGAGFTASA